MSRAKRMAEEVADSFVAKPPGSLRTAVHDAFLMGWSAGKGRAAKVADMMGDERGGEQPGNVALALHTAAERIMREDEVSIQDSNKVEALPSGSASQEAASGPQTPQGLTAGDCGPKLAPPTSSKAHGVCPGCNRNWTRGNEDRMCAKCEAVALAPGFERSAPTQTAEQAAKVYANSRAVERDASIGSMTWSEYKHDFLAGWNAAKAPTDQSVKNITLQAPAVPQGRRGFDEYVRDLAKFVFRMRGDRVEQVGGPMLEDGEHEFICLGPATARPGGKDDAS